MQTPTTIAVVGMACRLPGASDLDSYWNLLCEGRSAIGPMPENRLDRRLYLDPSGKRMGTTYSDLVGVVEPLPHDPDLCPLSVDFAASCDPTHVTFCNVAASAVRHAGWDPHHMPMQRGGVYVGHTRGTVIAGQLIYGTLVAQAAEYLRECGTVAADTSFTDSLIKEVVRKVRSEMPSRREDGSPHLDAHFVASLVSKALGWQGPAMAVNAACASSLIAMSMGIAALQRGEIECAIVGGASHCKLDSLVLFSKAQSASATGSRPFDDAADGLVAAEGYVALVLKTVENAVRDGDQIHAVIRGVGISSDGKGKSLWAPRKEGQIEAIRRAYSPNLPLDQVQYIEAHATSTQVGDATELAALEEVFGPIRRGLPKILIGTAKGNVGHTLETAGMAGLIKAVLAMKHGLIPPAVNLQTLNTKIDWQSLGLEVARHPTPWRDTMGSESPKHDPLRTCAVNAFGIGGMNVHVVLQNRLSDDSQPSSKPLSHRTVRSTKDDRIAIIGAAGIFPGALNLSDFARSLDSKESMLASVSPLRWRADLALDAQRRRPHHSISDLGGMLNGWQYDWKRHRVPPKQLEAADPLQFLLLDCVEAAIADACLLSEKWDRARAAVLIGTDFLGDFSADLQLAVRLPHLLDSIAVTLRIQGIAEPVIQTILVEFEDAFVRHNKALLDETGSFTTSTLASRITKTFDLMGGAASLDAGDASAGALLKVASDWLVRGRCDSIICASGQRALGLFNYERLSLLGRLQGNDGQGFLAPGEGAGVLVLRRLDDAVRDGNPIRAIIESVEVTADEEPEKPTSVMLKFGHLGGASGIAELLARLVRNPDDDKTVSIYGGGGQCYRVTLGDPKSNQSDLPSETTPKEAVASRSNVNANVPTYKTIRIGGRDWKSVADTCRKWGECQIAWNDIQETIFQDDDYVRVVLVAKNSDDLAQKLTLAGERLETPQARGPLAARGILCRRLGDRPTRIAWMFAGQGSQYNGMLREFVANHPRSRSILEQIDQTFLQSGVPAWSEIAWSSGQELGSDVMLTKLSVLGANWLLAETLLQNATPPAIVGGHSFGEYAAMACAGVWTWADAVVAGRARAQAVVEHCAGGSMLCTDAEARTVELLCRTIQNRGAGEVYLANHNSPHQCVVGGEERAVEALAELLKTEGFRAIPIAVPRPYHTPLMRGTCDPLKANLAAITIQPARIPVISSVTNRYEADPEAFRGNLIQQMVTPVRYVDLVNRLDSDGVELILEIGPGQVLTKLHRQILGSDGPMVLSTDDRREGTTMAMQLAMAALDLFVPLKKSHQPAVIISELKVNHLTVSSDLPCKAPVKTEQIVAPSRPNFSDDALRNLNIVELFGTPREMGIQYGRIHEAAIRESAHWIADAVQCRVSSLPALTSLADDREMLFSADDLEELAGIAEGSGVYLETVIASNLYAYPDLSGLGGCGHMAMRDGEKQWLHGANEDLPVSLMLPPLRQRTIQWREPNNGIAHMTFSAAGQLGGIVGMNVAGLSLSSAMLLDRPRPPDVPAGLLHGSIVRHILKTCCTIDEVWEWMQGDKSGTRGRGGWALMLTDSTTCDAMLIEYDGEEIQTRRGVDLHASNHCQLLAASDSIPMHSQRRGERLSAMLCEQTQPSNSLRQAFQILRDQFDSRVGRKTIHPTMNTVRRLDNQLSVVMRPKSGELWIYDSQKTSDDGFIRLELPRPSAPPMVKPHKRASQPTLSQAEYVQKLQSYTPSKTRVCDRFVVSLVSSTPSSLLSNTLLEGGIVVGSAELAKALSKASGTAWISTELDKLTDTFSASGWVSPHVVFALSEATDASLLTNVFSQFRDILFACDKSGSSSRLTLTSLSRLGGDFGLSGDARLNDADCLAGLLKSIVMERRSNGEALPRCLALDVSADESNESIAQSLIRLWQSASSAIEWCADTTSQQFFQTRVVPTPATKASGSDQSNVVHADACWILTGGGRGITALAAERLCQRYQVAVHLIGSTRLEIKDSWLDLDGAGLEALKKQTILAAASSGVRPPISAWNRIKSMLEVAHNLKRMRSEGLEVHYHACDLRDVDAVHNTFAAIRQFGKPIQGIIHGAGFERSGRLDKKQIDDVKRTLAVKLDGFDAIVAETEQDPVKWFIGFGSTAGRFGSVGQADYALANDALARRMGRLGRLRQNCRCVCMHWTAWGDTGMAMRPEVLKSLKARGIALLPAEEGLDHLIDEIESTNRDCEVVITDGGRFQQVVANDELYKVAIPTASDSVKGIPVENVEAGIESNDLVAASVTGRYVLRMQEEAHGQHNVLSRPIGRAVVWGNVRDGQVVSDGLKKRGIDCTTIDEASDPKEALPVESFDTLILVVPVETSAAPKLIRRLLSFVQNAFASLAKNDKEKAVNVAALIPLGGSHALDGRSPTAATLGGISGLIKALAVEFQHRGFMNVRCQSIDVGSVLDNDRVMRCIDKIENPGESPEISVANDRDYSLVYQLAELPIDAALSPPRPESDWIVTGGARGITCEVALQVGKQFGLRLHLLGSTNLSVLPDRWFQLTDDEREKLRKQTLKDAIAQHNGEPPIRAWQRIETAAEVAVNLQRFADAGVEIVYHCCDLTSPTSILSTVEKVLASGHPITGLIHGAGYEKSADILKKTNVDIDRTLAIKIDAFESILDTLKHQPLAHVIAFGSISGRLGSLGQIDYCTGNDAIAKRVCRLRAERPHCQATSFAWHSWDEIGMAARPETRRIKERLGLVYMGIAEGIRRVISELKSGLPEPEVLITTEEHLRRMRVDHLVLNVPANTAFEIAPNHLIQSPLLSKFDLKEQKFSLTLNPISDPFLVQHRFKDRPLFPLVIGIEAMLQSARESRGLHDVSQWTLNQLKVHGPLRFPTDNHVDAFVQLEEVKPSCWRAEFESYFRNASGQRSPKPRLHFSGEVSALNDPSRLPASLKAIAGPVDQSLKAKLRNVAIRDDLVLYHGPAFRMVQQIAIDEHRALATIHVPELCDIAGTTRSSQGWITSPAVIDACLFACGIHLYVADSGAVTVPMGIDRLTIERECRPGDLLSLQLLNRSIEGDSASFDFVLVDERETVYLWAEGYMASVVARSHQTARENG